MMQKLFLVDAYALIYRYYYAFLGRPMRNNEGMNTSVVFGFVKFLREILKRENPDLLGVAFDPKGGSFRSQIFPEYKANRTATPEDIILSVPYVKRVLEAMCIPVLEVAGYEADDVIGTLAIKAESAGYEVYMVTPDKDYGQLVRDNCKIYRQRGTDQIEIIDREAIREKYGIDDPILVRDILAIWGDSSDNIPGVPGIGEKGACKLVQSWGEVENVIANASQIKGKQGESIIAWGDKLLLAKELTTICLDVPIDFNPADLTMCQPNTEALRDLFIELNFKGFLADLTNQAPAIQLADGPRQEPQTQLATVARNKAAAQREASLVGQGNLFDTFKSPAAADGDVDNLEQQFAEDQPPTMATIQSVDHNYILVEDLAQLRDVVAIVADYPEFCFDTETTGFDHFNDRIVGLSIAVEPHAGWYVPFPVEGVEAYVELLRPLFENEKIAKIGQNIKFDILALRQLGLSVRGRKYDTMILHYLLDPESRHNMNALAERYLGYIPVAIETLIGRGARQLTMDMVNIERVKEYAVEDADITLQLKAVLLPKVQELGQEGLYFQIEEPMIDVLADIESAGVKIDTQALATYAVELNAQLLGLETKIRTEAAEPGLNINSTRQLGTVLFAKMRISDKPKMTKTKQFCTDEEYLQSFAHKHKIVDLILEYRGVKKLLSTYVEALPLLINRATGRIHTSYNQAVTATGRLSSTNPNLQNIPIRDPLGRPIRRAFIPTDSDHVLISADYSQVELRLMAHLSGDQSLIEAFRQGEDIHAATAAKLFGRELSEVSTEERRRAKTANFGIIYGISAFGLSQRLEISRTEAKELIEGYFASYPDVKRYMESVVEQARINGFVTTIFGRRRYLNDIGSGNAIARGLAERNAVNAPIQGSAADIMKLAMIEVHRRFAAEGIRSRVTLQVHDELVVDTLREEQQRVVQILCEAMESAAKLKVKLDVDYGVGDNWLDAH